MKRMKRNPLKGRIAECGYSGAAIGRILGRAQSYMSNHISDPGLFSVAEMYTLCDLLEIPYSEIPKYFPPIKR